MKGGNIIWVCQLFSFCVLAFTVQQWCWASNTPSAASSSATMIVERIVHSNDGKTKFDAMHGMAFDAKGFLWIASEVGLLRFDGAQVDIWGVEQGLSNNLALAVIVDRDDMLWIATRRGLNQFDPRTHTFTHFLTDETITEVIEAKDGSLYVATLNGVFVFDSDRILRKQWTHVENELRSNNVYSVFEDKHNNIWIGYLDAGVSVLNPKSQTVNHFKHTSDPNSLPSNHVREFAEDASGRLWLGSWGQGLSRLNDDGKSFTRYILTEPDGELNSDIITDLMLDSRGILWVTADKGGVFRYDSGRDRFDHFTHEVLNEKSLLSNTVRSAVEDRFNNIWFITFPGGLNRYHPFSNQFENWHHHLLDQNSLSDSSVLSVFQGDDDSLWVGTEAGLNKISPDGRISRYVPNKKNPKAIQGLAITALAKGPGGDLWVGSWATGLSRMNRASGEFTRVTQSQNFDGANIWVLFLDSRNTLWVGTENEGLYRYNPRTDSFNNFRYATANADGISSNYIQDIAEDSDGILWLGTQNGLNRFDPITEQFSSVVGMDGIDLATMRIKGIQIDGSGDFWLATQNKGVLKWNRKKNKIYSVDKENGLPNNTVSAIVYDANHALWVSTLAGIAKVNTRTLAVELVLSQSDGLISSTSIRRAAMLTREQRLLFGTVDGLAAFYPKKLAAPAVEPLLEITRFKLLDHHRKLPRSWRANPDHGRLL